MKHLIAIDSDGTLRHSNGKITKGTKRVIKELVDLGNTIIICTGRPRYHGLTISKEVGLSDYLVSSNGAEVYDIKNDKVLFGYYVPKYICKKIYNDAKRLNFRVIFACGNTEYVTMFKRIKEQTLLDDNNPSVLFNSNVKQVMVVSKNRKEVLKYRDELVNKYKCNLADVAQTANDEVFFSIISKKTSKGYALKRLAASLKIKDIIAIGNDENDLSMFEGSTTGVCVSNAENDIKEKADIVIGSNDEDGVRKYLETLK